MSAPGAAGRRSLTLTRAAHAGRWSLTLPLTRTLADLRWTGGSLAHVGQPREHGCDEMSLMESVTKEVRNACTGFVDAGERGARGPSLPLLFAPPDNGVQIALQISFRLVPENSSRFGNTGHRVA